MIHTYIITGANGHVAQTVIEKLRNEDCEIRGLILPSEENQDKDNVRYYKGDITKPETLNEIFSGVDGESSVVIHAAGLISIGNEITKPLFDVNVVGTRNMIDACIKFGIGRLVYVSSVHAIDEGDGLHVIKEVNSFSKDRVVGAYAKTKAEASQEVMDAIGGGLDAVIVHPSGILGPGDNGRNHITQLILSYLNGKLPGGVTGGYDFVDVRDVADGIISAAKKGRKGECYILSNRYIPIPDLMKFLQRATGGKRIVCFPLSAAKMMAPLFEWVGEVTHTRPLFTRYSLHTMESNGRFSHDKATMELGYSPRDMMETVRDTVTYLQANVLASGGVNEQKKQIMDTQPPFEFRTLRELFLRSTSRYAEHPFCQFADGSESLNYRDFADRVNKLSACLCRHGIGTGDKVAILSENMPNWSVAFFATVAFNRVAVPLLCGYSAHEVESFLDHSGTRAVLVSKKLLPKICKVKFELIIIIDDLSVYKSVEKGRDVHCLRAPSHESLATIIYTSGTSGHPKGVMLSHGNLCHSVLEAKYAQAADESDRWLSILPMSHAYELAFGLLYPLMVGGSIHYIKGLPSPSTLLPAMQKVRPTLMMTVPLIAEKIYKGIQRKVDGSKLLSWMRRSVPVLFYSIIGKELKKKTGGAFRFFGIGGAKLNPEVEEFLKRCRFPYAIGYGLTETAPLLCNAVVGKTVVGSTGVPAYGVDVKLSDLNPETGEGEIIARGPNVMMGYFREPELTAEAIDREGWFHTGDLACVDAQGRFFIKGRLKNIILGASGENIYPEEIEQLINSYPGVDESVVVERGSRLVALVHMEEGWKDSLTGLEKRIQEYVNQQISSFSALSCVEFVKEPFQKTATSKIKRFLYTQPSPA